MHKVTIMMSPPRTIDRSRRSLAAIVALAALATACPARAEFLEAGSRGAGPAPQRPASVAQPRAATPSNAAATPASPARQSAPAPVRDGTDEIEANSATAAPAAVEQRRVGAGTSAGSSDDTRFGTDGALDVGPGPFGSHEGGELGEERTPDIRYPARQQATSPVQGGFYTGVPDTAGGSVPGTAAGPQYSTQLPATQGVGRR